MPPAWLAAIRAVVITDRSLMVSADRLARGNWGAIATEFGEAVAEVVAAHPPGELLVQVREKDLDGGPLFALVRAALGVGARVAVNDRLDVALAAGADAVHLPGVGLPIAVARALASDLVIGVSIHDPAHAREAAAAGADLVQLGPIFATPGKGTPLGVGALTTARRDLADHVGVHLVAVGGIETAAQITAACDAGAHATAAIRASWALRSRAIFGT